MQVCHYATFKAFQPQLTSQVWEGEEWEGEAKERMTGIMKIEK